MVILCGLGTSAQQYDLFWGLSPTQYYINYSDGFVGKLNDQKLTLISSDAFFNTEVVALADYTKDLGAKVDAIVPQMEKLREEMVKLYDRRDLLVDGLIKDMDIINTNFENLLTQYAKFATALEDRYNQLQRSPRRIREAAYNFNISDIMNNYILAKGCFDIYLAYLQELKKAGEDYEASFLKTGNGLVKLVDEYARQVDVRIDMYNYYANYWNKNGNYMSANMILEFGQKLQAEVDYITKLILEEPKNPTEELDYVLNAATTLYNSSVTSFNDVQNYLNELYKTVPPLAKFSEVLYVGVEGNPFGLYYYIKDNEGVLTIPSSQTYYDAFDYPVTGIEGNIFTRFYEAANPQCRKVVIPATVTGLSNGAFAVEGLETVEVRAGKVPAMTDDCFTENVYSKATLVVPDGMAEAYAAAPGWKNFANIKSASQSAIESVTADGVSIRVENGIIYVDAPEGTSVSVYNINGATVYSGTGREINLPARGIYIVRAANKVIKVAY